MFTMNQMVFDSAAKEVVKITNGIELNGKFVPTEAIAIRVLGLTEDNKPILAYTHRKVDVNFLSPYSSDTLFDVVLTSQLNREHFKNFGRV